MTDPRNRFPETEISSGIVPDLLHRIEELETLVKGIKGIAENGAMAYETMRLNILMRIRDYNNHRALNP